MANNRLVPGSPSDECRTFTGAPSQSNQANSQNWTAKWREVEFICDMSPVENTTGTASAQEGYNITLTNQDGSTHKYFFMFIDHNIHPDNSALVEAVKSFETR